MTGPYDNLYKGAEVLWPEGPGRVISWMMDYCALPSRVLDLGAGDGKNAIHFERLTIPVDCVDISDLAYRAYLRRFAREGLSPKGTYVIANVAESSPSETLYGCVICYGLAHCLDDDQLSRCFDAMTSALQPGGFVCFCALTDGLPIPSDHQTDSLFLRSHNSYIRSFDGYFIRKSDCGTITEIHPNVEPHSHQVSWILAQKP